MLENIKKTYYYMKRNGIRNAYYASMERLYERKHVSYTYKSPDIEALKKQKEYAALMKGPLISVLVPTYRTPKRYLEELLCSLQEQTYQNYELVIADASEDQSVYEIISRQCEQDNIQQDKIRYVKLKSNLGIAENTNAGLHYCNGEYTALLDHDDLLTPDALFEMVAKGKEKDCVMVYSDEDKYDDDRNIYFDHHRKPDLNLDLLLTNNYICHFTMIRTEMLKKLCFRKEYDGAQDFDLFLRVVAKAKKQSLKIEHVPRVLYHWRSHASSTAVNPQSKLYAYEAGKHAVEDFLQQTGMKACVEHEKHLGFYRITYKESMFLARPDIGAVCPRKVKGNRLIPTFYDENERYPFEGLNKHFSGYFHRAVLRQDVFMGDIRTMIIRKECKEMVEDLILSYLKSRQERNLETQRYDFSKKPSPILTKEQDGYRLNHDITKRLSEEELFSLSKQVSEKIREKGLLIVYDPV